VKDGDSLAITIALPPIVFPQMPVHFSAFITYYWDFNKAWHPNGPPRNDTSRWDCLGWVSETELSTNYFQSNRNTTD